MSKRDSYEKVLTAFRKRDIDVLIGTQMIAKGLDLPLVTLVGVLSADVGLFLPDFRAAERTFQLVTQVAGRTGRGDRGGRVIVQTFSPEHPAIQAASRHDYVAFATDDAVCRARLCLRVSRRTDSHFQRSYGQMGRFAETCKSPLSGRDRILRRGGEFPRV